MGNGHIAGVPHSGSIRQIRTVPHTMLLVVTILSRNNKAIIVNNDMERESLKIF